MILSPSKSSAVEDVIKEALSSLGGVQPAASIRAWINLHYPSLDDRAVGTCLRYSSVNQPSAIGRHPGREHFLFNPARGEFELYDSARHGIYDDRGYREDEMGNGATDFVSSTNEGTPTKDEFTKITNEFDGKNQFAYEAHLRDYLVKNLGTIERGLVPWTIDVASSVEYVIDGRRIDILAKDKDGVPVIVELKLSRGHDRVIGQALYYQAALMKRLGVPKIRLILLAGKITKELKLACSQVEDISLFEYSLEVKVHQVHVDRSS